VSFVAETNVVAAAASDKVVLYFNSSSTNLPALVLAVHGRVILVVRGGLSTLIASKANIHIIGSCCSSTLPTTITVVVFHSGTWHVGVGGAQIFRPYGG
jgi:hypothetical protein